MFVELPFSSKIPLKFVTKLLTSVGISFASFLVVFFDAEELSEEQADKVRVHKAVKMSIRIF